MSISSAPPRSLRGESHEFDYSLEDYNNIASILYAEAGIDLGASKATLVYARLAKLVRRAGLNSFRDYCGLIRQDEQERSEMVEALTTNTTSFFRERHHFEHLGEVVLPSLIKAARSGIPVRIWSSAASSGQEPYSIALTILAVAPDAGSLDVKILATDLNSKMIVHASSGIYPREELEGVGQQQLTRYFNRTGTGSDFVVGDDLKRLVSFRVLNLHGDWPMRRPFDVIFCRNVMIYFDGRTQEQLWSKLSDRLSPDGFLYIGHSERVTGVAARQLRQTAVTTFQKHANTGLL